MPRQIAARTTLENLKREAKRWLKALQSGDGEAYARLLRSLPTRPAAPTLRDVQHALALEHGVSGWNSLKERLAQDAAMRRYDKVAEALVEAYRDPRADSMRIVWDYFGHMRAWDAMRRYVRLDLGKTESPKPGEEDVVTLAEAQYLVARFQGFDNWQALTAFALSVPPGKTTIVAKSIRLYSSADSQHPDIGFTSRDWDEVLAVLAEKRLTGLHADGQMTDAVLERLCRLEHITALDLNGSRALTDDGLRHLSRLSGLRRLNLGGCGISDRGLEVLRRMPALESISLGWTPITDEGVAHLAGCDELRQVDLSGTLSGDGAIRTLAGKTKLADFRSGETVSNDGLGLLRELPVFRTWHGGKEEMALLRPDAQPNFLMLRGTFTDQGMAHLSVLDGLFALNIDNSRLAVTGAGLRPLRALPHLSLLAFDAKNESMADIAALPRLRFLMCQDTSAGDEGFVALSSSRTIEHIWGRRCYNLRRRGFMALADMPALRYLSVSCKNVDDTGLSALARFPALTELMPMDVPDEGYRHIGQCHRLESLVLMYCRDTGDRATELIASLPRLQKYFASYNRITDRTPQILSGMDTLEEITFDSCAGLSNAGVEMLARLPRLRELRVGSMPNVTQEVTSAFRPDVRVRYGT